MRLYGATIWWIAISAILILGVTLAWFSRHEHAETIESEYRYIEAHAKIAESNLALLVRHVGQVLERVSKESPRLTDPARAAAYEAALSSNESLIPEIRALAVTDRAGRIRVGTAGIPKDFDASGLERFWSHRDGSTAAPLHVTRPDGVFQGEHALAISMPIRDQRGNFAGMAVAILGFERLSEFLASVRPAGAGSAVALFDDSGDLLFRLPDPEKYIGRSIATASQFKAFVASGGISRSRGLATLDGVERLHVVHAVGGTDLGVSVARSVDDALQGWRARTGPRLATFVLGTLAVLLLAWIAHRRHREGIERLLKQEEAERALADREIQYRTIVETARDGFWMVAPTGELLGVNDAYVVASGYRRDELLKMRVSDLEAVESADDVGRHIEKIQAHGGDLFETLHRRKDGSLWPVEVSVNHCADAGGCLFAFLRDITERKWAADALRQSELRFRATFEQAAVGIAHVSPDGRWLRVNDRLCDILGYARDSLMTLTFKDITHPDDLGRDVEALNQMLAGRMSVYRREKRYLRMTGAPVWGHVTVTLVRRADNSPDYFIAVVEDINERKRAESALAALRDELDNLTKWQIASQTVAALAHELNQPLCAISAFAATAQRMIEKGNPQPGQLSRIVGETANQAQRAGDVIHELMTFLNKGEVNALPVDLDALIRKVVQRLDRGGHAIAVDLRLPSGLPPVRANGLQIAKVLTNLMENGCDAMTSAGVPNPALRVAAVPRDGDHVVEIVVEDCGCGMDEDTRLRVFEPFYTTKQRGLGMGLAISRAIVEAHGGQIWVQSERGAGSRFHVTLPLA